MESILVIAFIAALVPMMLAFCLLMARLFRQLAATEDGLSPVSRQHLEIFQGGELNEAKVKIVKRRFQELLEAGNEEIIEASLRPGTHYVYQVRALAEIGTESAAHILERQLHRKLSEDQMEQAWYWNDLASSLRAMNRQESLPHLLRCAEHAMLPPLGHYFAAETVCFLGFPGYVRHPETKLGRAAMRVLHRTLEGLRFGVQPQIIAEARLGEVLETLWDHRPTSPDPLMVRIFHEVSRLVRRGPANLGSFDEDLHDAERYEWQMARLTGLESTLREYVQWSAQVLKQKLAELSTDHLQETLLAFNELRLDVGDSIRPLLSRADAETLECMVDTLRWSKSKWVAGWLRDYANYHVQMERRAHLARRSYLPWKPRIPEHVPYEAILRTLRAFPSPATEKFLLLATHDFDPTVRLAAISSLGWWEPMDRDAVLSTLAQFRRDLRPEIRQLARAALARLGERAALHWFRQSLYTDSPLQVIEGIQIISQEGLTLLWPEIDRLADSESPEIAHYAREALARFHEESFAENAE